MRLLVNSSVLNAYAEGMSNVSNEIGSGAPNSDTALMRFKSIDRYFLTCKIVTLVFCLPWPLTLLASVMSLAGQFQDNTPLFLRVLVRLGGS